MCIRDSRLSTPLTAIFDEKNRKTYSVIRLDNMASDAEMNKEASHIVELNPDFLIVGMGALMQEKFLRKVKRCV